MKRKNFLYSQKTCKNPDISTFAAFHKTSIFDEKRKKTKLVLAIENVRVYNGISQSGTARQRCLPKRQRKKCLTTSWNDVKLKRNQRHGTVNAESKKVFESSWHNKRVNATIKGNHGLPTVEHVSTIEFGTTILTVKTKPKKIFFKVVDTNFESMVQWKSRRQAVRRRRKPDTDTDLKDFFESSWHEFCVMVQLQRNLAKRSQSLSLGNFDNFIFGLYRSAESDDEL